MSLQELMRKESKRISEKAEGGGKFEKTPWWTPKVGDNVIRILPNTVNADLAPFIKATIHYIGVRKKDSTYAQIPVRCLADTVNGKKVFPTETHCPICRKYEKLMKEGDKENARNLRQVGRYLYNIIDITSRTVHPYAAPETLHGFIVENAGDLENPFDLTNGRDWKVVKKVDPRKAKNLGTSYSARPSIKDSALPEKLRHLVAEAVDLKTLYSENEKKKMLEFLGEEVSDEFEEDLKKAPAKTAATRAKVQVAEAEEAEETEEDSFGEDTFQPPPKKTAAPAARVKASAPKEEDLGVNFEDEELERELKELGLED